MINKNFDTSNETTLDINKISQNVNILLEKNGRKELPKPVFQYKNPLFEKDQSEIIIAIKKLIIALMICTSFLIFEIIGGLLAKSTLIQTNSAHLAVDIIGLLLKLSYMFATEDGK
jgi:hypothetical protein